MNVLVGRAVKSDFYIEIIYLYALEATVEDSADGPEDARHRRHCRRRATAEDSADGPEDARHRRHCRRRARAEDSADGPEDALDNRHIRDVQ
ncbi:unnamed protein product [Leptosia nina]|uniref:Uncharacterized protein n=1 Tax=Leptosia nina TaxID=320188 RepID=A0AAV1JHV5_9NEOP